MRYLVCLILILSLALLSMACPSTSPTTTAPGTTTPPPTAASPSPTMASPSPTAASPSPTATSPSPTAASPSPTAASPSPTVATTSPSPGATTTVSPSPTAAGLTFGQLATAGRTVYTNSCALCHGDNGQGGTAPALIGDSANLEKFNTAQGLFDYIRTSMPANAPGSLPENQYQQVTGYLLVENNYVSDDTAFNANQMSTIQLNQ